MIELASYKVLFSGIAFALTIVLFVPYIRSILKGETIPHVFSWTIWAFGTFVVFLAQLSDGGGLGAWPIGLSACITGVVAILAFTRRGESSITKLDWTFFVLAMAAIPSWVLTSDPMWAVILLTTADLLGFGPTIRRGYEHPHQEHAGFFAFGALRNVFVVLALENYSVTTVLFPAGVGLACLVVAGLFVRRRVVSDHAQIAD